MVDRCLIGAWEVVDAMNVVAVVVEIMESARVAQLVVLWVD